MRRAWLVGAVISAAVVVCIGWGIALLTSADYPGILFVPLAVGTVAAFTGIAWVARGRARSGGIALLIAAIAVPTFFAAALNVPLLVLAALLILRRRRPMAAPA